MAALTIQVFKMITDFMTIGKGMDFTIRSEKGVWI